SSLRHRPTAPSKITWWLFGSTATRLHQVFCRPSYSPATDVAAGCPTTARPVSRVQLAPASVDLYRCSECGPIFARRNAVPTVPLRPIASFIQPAERPIGSPLLVTRRPQPGNLGARSESGSRPLAGGSAAPDPL